MQSNTIDAYQLLLMSHQQQLGNSDYTLEKLINIDTNWKVVYCINNKYYIEDILAYAFIKNGLYYEFIPITLPEAHSFQRLQDYSLKEGFIGMINSNNELIVNEHLVEDVEINIQEIKKALKRNRFKLD